MPISIAQAVGQLLQLIGELQRAFPKKKFTLDGRLLGDIGEMLVERAYDIELFDRLQRHHDGRCRDGRLVQIKATMQDALSFPADHVPDFYLGIKIYPDGSFTEIFNGPGKIAARAVARRTRSKTNLHAVSISALTVLSNTVEASCRIPLRTAPPQPQPERSLPFFRSSG